MNTELNFQEKVIKSRRLRVRVSYNREVENTVKDWVDFQVLAILSTVYSFAKLELLFMFTHICLIFGVHLRWSVGIGNTARI